MKIIKLSHDLIFDNRLIIIYKSIFIMNLKNLKKKINVFKLYVKKECIIYIQKSL